MYRYEPVEGRVVLNFRWYSAINDESSDGADSGRDVISAVSFVVELEVARTVGLVDWNSETSFDEFAEADPRVAVDEDGSGSNVLDEVVSDVTAISLEVELGVSQGGHDLASDLRVSSLSLSTAEINIGYLSRLGQT